MNKIGNLLVVMTFLGWLLSGCGGNSQSAVQADSGAGEKLTAVATTTLVGDLVKNVAGDLANVTVLLPVGADPHSFEPAPQDIATVADAQLIFENGLELEQFLARMIENSGVEVSVVSLAEGLDTREFAAGEMADHDEDHADEATHDEDHAGETDHAGHDHSGPDPHIWMSPANARVMVENIARALAQRDPANAKTYQANAAAYQQKLDELDRWVKTEVEQIAPENKKLVTDHATFGYFADRYGFAQIGTVIPSFSTNAEPSAQELAELQHAVVENNVKAVFVGTTVNPVLASRLAEDAGIEVVSLYTGSLGKPGSGAETYIDFIRYNTTAIVDALK